MEDSGEESDVVEEHKEERDEVILCPHHNRVLQSVFYNISQFRLPK